MRSLQLNQSWIKDPENYSDLKVMNTGAGYYIGTSYTDPEGGGFTEPGSRDTGYFKTREEAEEHLAMIEAHPNPSQFLRLHP